MKWVFVLALLISCQPVKHGIDAKVMGVFSDFDYVGSGAAKFKQDGSLDPFHVAPHGEKAQQNPDRLVIGTQYVFHYKGNPDNEAMGLRVLPERLKKLGYKVVEAPNYNGGTFLYTYIGGPYFYIKFSDGEHEAIIANQRDTKPLVKDQVIDDYVLVFLR